MKVKAVPRDCRGTREDAVPLKKFTAVDAEDLRHQMYMYCINFGFANNKEEAKQILKKFGFLQREKQTNRNK